MPADTIPAEERLRSWQIRVFSLLWGAYASYYLCRVNFAVAQPVILKEFPEWTNAQVGSIPSTFSAVYAVGQLINGTLGHRFGARRIMTAALLLVGLSNVLFASAATFGSMRLLWAINAFGQSAGWALMVQTLSDWNRSARRAILISRLSTCYQFGHVISWLLAGFLCETIGWRAAFLVPGLFLFPVALIFFAFVRDTPTEAGLSPVRDDLDEELTAAGTTTAPNSALETDQGPSMPKRESTWRILTLTLRNPILWLLGFVAFVISLVRYSLINWSVQYLTDFHHRTIGSSVVMAIMFPLVGSLGAISAGWASDKIFGHRRAPVCLIMMLGLTLACALMAFVPRGAWLSATALLGLAGFMLYGPDMLMGGAATVDQSHPQAGSIATGLAMCFGALGAILSGAGIGYLQDRAHGDWSTVFLALAALPLLPAALMFPIWNTRPRGFN